MSAKNIEDAYPLSPMQEGLLFHNLYAPESGIYITQVACRLHDLDIPRFAQVWQQLIDRQPILRSAFVWKNVEKPLQVVGRQVGLPLEQQDWRALSLSAQEERFESYLEADRRAGFNLMKAPVMRLALFQTGERDYQFLWTHHHILMDGWSVSLLLSDFFKLYKTLSRGENPYVERRRPYRDYIGWLQQQDLREAEAFWRRTLKGFTEPSRLGIDLKIADAAVSPPQSQNYEEQYLNLSELTTDSLQKMAREQQATLNTVVQGAWAVLLGRYSGSEDVVFGATVSGRPATLPGVEEMVGLFINTLPVRVQVRGESEVRRWLQELQEQQVEVRQYEHSPLVEVQGWSEAPRGMALFETILVFENYPITEILKEQDRGLDVSEVRSIERNNYPLALIVFPGPRLRLNMIYDRQRYEAASIARMLRHLNTLLEAIALEPEQQVGDLPLLTSSERHQLLFDWNHTPSEFPLSHCIHQLFEAQARRSPDALALACSSTNSTLSYAELDLRSTQLAHYLRHRAITTGSVVALLLDHSVETLIAILGVLKAGAAYLPLDAAHPPARLAFALSDANAAMVLTQQALMERLSPMIASRLPADTVLPPTLWLDTQWDLCAGLPTDTPSSSEQSSDSLAYLIYTSGSTGQPKAVMIQHRSLVNYICWAKEVYLREGEAAAFALYSSLAFDLTVTSLFVPLVSGQTLSIYPKQGLESPLLAALEENRTQVLKLTPSHLSMLKEMDNRHSSIRRLIVGGEALSTELARAVSESFDHSIELYNEYGPTETTVGCMIYRFEPDRDDRAWVAIGRPAANTQIYLLDKRLEPVAENVTGEIYIGGQSVAFGYFNRPELTAQSFVAHPYSERGGERLYKTGDLARRLVDGNLEFVGRIDEQIKVRGFRIELEEIRASLMRHPNVKDASVVVRGASAEDTRLVAYLVAETDDELRSSDLRDYLKELLPEYMVPSAFVLLDELPLTPNGKIDYRALPKPEGLDAGLKNQYVAPQTDLEQLLEKIWHEVLGIEKIGVHDNFFDLGGHSLLMIQVQRKVRESLDRELSLVEMFKYPTIHLLSEWLKQDPDGAATPPAFQRSFERAETRRELVNRQREARKRNLATD